MLSFIGFYIYTNGKYLHEWTWTTTRTTPTKMDEFLLSKCFFQRIKGGKKKHNSMKIAFDDCPFILKSNSLFRIGSRLQIIA
jgi:hypothetical protein